MYSALIPLLRMVIINKEKCKPKKCGQECKRYCPINMQGKQCVSVEVTSKMCSIAEVMCVGCGMCIKKCPFNALTIVNLPKDLSKDVSHRFGANSFKLHRLPTPQMGQVLGLVGTNGIGKSTALQILAGRLVPNLGRYDDQPSWQEILKNYRGSELQNYFLKVVEDKIKAQIKPQYVDAIPKFVKGNVTKIMAQKDQTKMSASLIKELDLESIVDRSIEQLSGGELQRFAILLTCCQDVNVYMFDEPSSYLDIKQRLRAAELIRRMVGQNKYVVCVEHDLSILDYLSDFVCCLYGEQSAYGIVSMPFAVREGINIFIDGYLPTENMKFREIELNFRMKDQIDDKKQGLDKKGYQNYSYEAMERSFGQSFHLAVKPGRFTTSEITILLGENGTGKTTFIRMLSGQDKEKKDAVPALSISYKPQYISPKFEGTVRDLLQTKLKNAHLNPTFQSEVAKPLRLEEIIDNEVQHLSGGELQRIALILALGKPADIFLLDEPSAYLDAEQRIITSKVIKRFILNNRKIAFIVEHDFIMASYLADQIIVYEGSPGKDCTANSPQNLIEGMNKFLALMGITFRSCLLYTSDAADEEDSVDLGGRRIFKKKKQ
eukprot:TRINITY_DN884_c0_g1_i2.p2 TRINITY_DN884_c0_g1~~TRINITY_DN884_c0_g1_i2.p2  ORF type:complete len:604 (+),score=86.97 TRINITY_DN884_c0_g1_i2:1942-3753(+)